VLTKQGTTDFYTWWTTPVGTDGGIAAPHVPYFSGVTTLSNSPLLVSGGLVGIGQAPATDILEAFGKGWLRDGVYCGAGAAAAAVGGVWSPAAGEVDIGMAGGYHMRLALTDSPNAATLANDSSTAYYAVARPSGTQSGQDGILPDGSRVYGGLVTAISAALPPLTGAGTGHAAGIAPDPGATSHARNPFYLGDDAFWHPILGCILNYNFVTTQESTTSGTAVDLPTQDLVTLTLDVAATVLIAYDATCVATVAGAAVSNYVVIDGVSALTDTVQEAVASYYFKLRTLYVKTALAAGSHVIKIQHSTNTGTSYWSNRLLQVIRLS
jgi:hypothetical protein